MNRIQSAVDAELAKFARIEANIQAACENGRITPEKAGEKIARAEQWCENRIAWIKGERRPEQRDRKGAS